MICPSALSALPQERPARLSVHALPEGLHVAAAGWCGDVDIVWTQNRAQRPGDFFDNGWQRPFWRSPGACGPTCPPLAPSRRCGPRRRPRRSCRPLWSRPRSRLSQPWRSGRRGRLRRRGALAFWIICLVSLASMDIRRPVATLFGLPAAQRSATLTNLRYLISEARSLCWLRARPA